MYIIPYTDRAGRTASIDPARLYRHDMTGELFVLMSGGKMRSISPDEEAAYKKASGMKPGGIVRYGPADAPDFANMTKAEIEAFARENHGVELDRRERKATLIDRVKALISA